MGKKYILTDDTYVIGDHMLHRIQAVKSFGDVKKGDLGGFIECENNLSHSGDCWLYDNAYVYGDANVSGNATIHDYGVVCGNASVSGNARIRGNALIHERAHICDASVVIGYSNVSGNSHIKGSSILSGYCDVRDSDIDGIVHICYTSKVINSSIKGFFKINNNAIIDYAHLYGSGDFGRDAYITSEKDFITIRGLYSSRDSVTFYKTKSEDIYVSYAGFCDSIYEFEKMVKKSIVVKNKKEYMKSIELVKMHFKK